MTAPLSERLRLVAHTLEGQEALLDALAASERRVAALTELVQEWIEFRETGGGYAGSLIRRSRAALAEPSA